MKYPDLLHEDISRIGLQESQMYNLIASKLVTDLVKTSLGPRGMDKIYIDILGEDTLTSHGGAFLRKVDVDHPASKTVIEAVNAVDTHVGDGTSTAAVLIGSLLHHAKKLLNLGIPTPVIVRGYERCMSHSLKIIDNVKSKSDVHDKKIMRQLLTTCLNGKAVYELEGVRFVDLIIEAILNVADIEDGHVDIDNIKFEEAAGNVGDSQLIRGTVIDKTIDSPSMPRIIKNAKILLINESLEPMECKTDAGIEIDSPEQMSRFIKQEDLDMDYLVRKIIDSGANVVISRKGINDFVQEALTKRGIITMRRVKYNDLWWIEKTTGAKTCKAIEKISRDELGFASKIYEKTVGGDRMVFVEGKSPKSVTLLLRGNSKRYRDEFHRNALNALFVLRNFIENPFIVYGAGSVEEIVAQQTREYAMTVEGKEQIAIEGFADAVEEIPLTLARNAGMNTIDTLTQFRAMSAVTTNGSKTGWHGIDYKKRKVSDISTTGIIETAFVKQQVFKTAVETVNMILNIDDVFMKNLIDNTHCHIDGHVHAHRDGGKAHNHFEQEGLEQRQMHHYF